MGDTTVSAITSDRTTSSVYAFTHATGTAAAAEIVAINKQTTAQVVTIQVRSSPVFHSATVYDLVTGNAAVVPATGAAPAITCACNTCTLSFPMPATSASTIVLR